MTHDIKLDGCRPTPLASYLKALGILRLIAEQADPDVKGWWRDERFWIRTKLTCDELTRFFLHDYAPSPIIAPWNAGSGFYFQEGKAKDKDPVTGKKIKTGLRNQATAATRIIDQIANAKAARLLGYKSAVNQVRCHLKAIGHEQAPSEAQKNLLVLKLRSSLDDGCLKWLDAAIALTSTELKFPPILGSGGNDGNLDFSSNYIQRLVEVINPQSGKPIDGAATLLDGALFAKATTGATSAAVGQFSPGAAGGPNSVSGFYGDSTLNSWDFILMLEGALVVAGGVVRRFSTDDRTAAAFPFTLRAAGAGYGTASQTEETDSRGEFWAPLWAEASTTGELQALFREGRIAQTRRPLRDGMDAARAIGSVGADRRIVQFQRYGFAKRQGLAYLATPLERRTVRPRPETALIADLDAWGWLETLRRAGRADSAPATFSSALRLLEDALFAMTGEGDLHQSACQAVTAIGRIARGTAKSKGLRESIGPPPALKTRWIDLGGSTPETRLAVALAGMRLDRLYSDGRIVSDATRAKADEFPFRAHIAPLTPGNCFAQPQWREGGASVESVWTEGSLVTSLVAVAKRRAVLAMREGAGGGAFAGTPGRLARLSDVSAFLGRETDDDLINDLALGFAWVSFARKGSDRSGKSRDRNFRQAKDQPQSIPLPLAYCAIKPIFAPPPRLTTVSETPSADGFTRKQMKFVPTIAPLLAAGRVPDAVDVAMARARADALTAPFKGLRPAGVDADRLLAALMFPISEYGLKSCLQRAYPDDNTERTNDHAA